VELENDVVVELLFDLHNRGPENRPGTCIFSCPKGGVRIVFGFEDNSKQRVFISGNIAGCIQNKTLIYCP
jgi:hypothetical protein